MIYTFEKFKYIYIQIFINSHNKLQILSSLKNLSFWVVLGNWVLGGDPFADPVRNRDSAVEA